MYVYTGVQVMHREGQNNLVEESVIVGHVEILIPPRCVVSIDGC
jgi:hypothetical protein